jgi:hypothetical protein
VRRSRASPSPVTARSSRPTPPVDELEALAAAALPLLEQANDDTGLVQIWLALRVVAKLSRPLRRLSRRVGAGDAACAARGGVAHTDLRPAIALYGGPK